MRPIFEFLALLFFVVGVLYACNDQFLRMAMYFFGSWVTFAACGTFRKRPFEPRV